MPADYDREQRELLDAVWADYDSDAPRLAYADWLEAIGDPADTARGRVIRLSCRIAPLPWSDPETRETRKVIENDLKKYRRAWLAGLPDEFNQRDLAVTRGMFEIHAHPTPAELLAHGDRWFRRSPPDVMFRLALNRGYGRRQMTGEPDWPTLFGKPWWERVLVLAVGFPLTALEVGIVGSHRGFGRLRELNLNDCRCGDAGALALAAAPHLGQLRTLSARNCELTVVGANALAGRGTLTRLERLHLFGNPVEVGEIRAADGVTVAASAYRTSLFFGVTPDPDVDEIPF